MKTVLLTILPCKIHILRKGNVQASQIGSAPAPVVVISADATRRQVNRLT